MAEYDDDDRAVMAAQILLTLRTRKLTQWPDWILPPSKELAAPAEPPSVDPAGELPPLPERWPRKPRNPLGTRESGWSTSLDGLYARLSLQPAPTGRSGASSSEEERAWTPPPLRKPKREPLSARRSASGSGASTSSGAARARMRVSVKVAAPARKEAFMAASSPDTPFDYATAARSGASSSGDEGAAKRKASRSGAPSSGDEGCSSPAKRSRPEVHGAAQPAAAAVKVEVPKSEENSRDEKGHLLFDLNEDISMAW